MKTVTMYVTPEQAKLWLIGHKLNRAERPNWITQLAGRITRGEWLLTHQGIAFNSQGVNVDGYHRLMAIIKSGIAVPLMVTTDAPKEMFQVIDGGIGRTYADNHEVSPAFAAVGSFLGTILFWKPSPQQQTLILDVIGPTLEELTEFCPTTKKGFTTSGVKAAACLRMLAGEDAEYIKQMYRNIVRVAHSELPPVGRAFIDQVYSNKTKIRGTGKFDLYARSLKVFNKSQKNITRLVIQDVEPFLEFAREILNPALSEKLANKKMPAVKVPEVVREKFYELPRFVAADY